MVVTAWAQDLDSGQDVPTSLLSVGQVPVDLNGQALIKIKPGEKKDISVKVPSSIPNYRFSVSAVPAVPAIFIGDLDVTDTTRSVQIEERVGLRCVLKYPPWLDWLESFLLEEFLWNVGGNPVKDFAVATTQGGPVALSPLNEADISFGWPKPGSFSAVCTVKCEDVAVAAKVKFNVTEPQMPTVTASKSPEWSDPGPRLKY